MGTKKRNIGKWTLACTNASMPWGKWDVIACESERVAYAMARALLTGGMYSCVGIKLDGKNVEYVETFMCVNEAGDKVLNWTSSTGTFDLGG